MSVMTDTFCGNLSVATDTFGWNLSVVTDTFRRLCWPVCLNLRKQINKKRGNKSMGRAIFFGVCVFSWWGGGENMGCGIRLDCRFLRLACICLFRE